MSQAPALKTSLRDRIGFLHKQLMDTAQEMAESTMDEDGAEDFINNMEKVQSHIDGMSRYVKADIALHAGSFAGTEYLFGFYNMVWFETAPYSEEILLDIAVLLIETTRPYRLNPFWQSLFENAEPVVAKDHIGEAIVNALNTSK